MEEDRRYLDALGNLAGGLAHDLNNLLFVIQNYARSLEKSFDPDDYRSGDAREIVEAGERAAALVRQLLAFAGRAVSTPRSTDVNVVISGMEERLRAALEQADIHMELSIELPDAWIDPVRLEEVVLELAVDVATARGARCVEIRTHQASVEGGGPVPAGDYVVITVAGADDDDIMLDHGADVFEPYASGLTSSRGLRLAAAYGTVRQAEGHVSQGDTGFSVYLPVIGGGRRPHETILVVDDDGSVLRLVRRLLENAGYEVVTASSGPDALSFCGRIDLLVTDVVMEPMSGTELAGEIAARTEVATIFMSGHPEHLITDLGMSVEPSRYLQKPFSEAQLLAKVRAALAHQRSDRCPSR